MASTDPTADDFVYDELAYLHENASEHGLPADLPPVTRTTADLGDGRELSGLLWGSGPPEIVFVHGTAQNAHTWDTVVLALGRPSLALDLPGHGHSSWRDDRAYDPRNLADDVAVAVSLLAPGAEAIVGMSLGGLVVMSLAARHSALVRRLLLVDVTPGVTRDKAKHIHEFIEGPPDFPAFADILQRTVEYNPTRSVSSLRRGIIHNAQREPDGSWRWRYDRRGRGTDAPPFDRAVMWDDLDAIAAGVPLLLARGGAEGSVVDDADVTELQRRRPETQVVVVEGAGHSIQGDRPLELAAIIEQLLSLDP